MAQISKGDTFTNGEQVTGARLNQLVDSSTLLVGAITDQPSITANTLEATDSTIVNDAGTLKEATIGDFLNSNLPITTSSITGGAGVDIIVTPAATRKFDVGGAFEAESINSVGAAAVGGALTVTGASTLTGNVIADNGFTSNGTANFTGVFQVNGAVGYVLTEVLEETMTSWSASASGNYDSIWTSTAFTKPSDEIWVFETDFHYSGVSGYAFNFGFRYSNQTVYTGTYKVLQQHYTVGNNGTQIYHQTNRWVEGTGTTLTALTLKVDTNAGASSLMTMFNSTYSFATFAGTSASTVIPSKFRIYKYKTA
jgi:hypothetical protein